MFNDWLKKAAVVLVEITVTEMHHSKQNQVKQSKQMFEIIGSDSKSGWFRLKHTKKIDRSGKSKFF